MDVGVAKGDSTLPIGSDARTKRLKAVMARSMLSQYNKQNLEGKLKDNQVAQIGTGTRPNVLKIPPVLVYKGARSRAGNLKEVAFESARQSDLSLMLHSAMQREFRGNPALYKDARNITPGRGSAYQSGLRFTANENFKKKSSS